MHGVLFHLLDVAFLGRAVPSTDALVVTSVKRISLLEWSKERLLSFLSLLLREGDVRAVSGEGRVESAALTHSVGPGLFTVDDLSVLFGIFITTLVLLALKWIFRVAHLVQVSKRLSFDASGEPGCALWNGTLGRPERDVLELRLAHLLVGAGGEGLVL